MSADTGNDVRRQAGWLPDQSDLEAWLRGRGGHGGGSDASEPLHPAVEALRAVIDGDPILRMHAHQMIEQVPIGREYSSRHLESVDHMLTLIDEVIRTAPEFSADSMVMTPLAGILDWTTATPAGFAFYRDPRVNDALRVVLEAWSEFLSSPESLTVLNDSESGWMGAAAQEAVGMGQFRHDPDTEHWGFASWNDFFTRAFRDGERPVASPDDASVVVAPCEATPYRIANGVRRRDGFWAKGEPYSLDELLAGDDSVDRLVGGTVFQAFLSAVDYHRWHSPVSGTVVSAFVQPGTYYSEADSQGDAAAEPTNSQGYMAHVATRAVLVVDADDPAIGLVACVFIGMVDVSSCLLGDGVESGTHLTKGDEVGRFQYGGSTVCVVFEPGVVEAFALAALPQAPDEEPRLMPVRSHLATVRRDSPRASHPIEPRIP
jgi:phosphatidylserine decarboxylase